MRTDNILRALAVTLLACMNSTAMAGASLTLSQTSAQCVASQRVGDNIVRTVNACAPGPEFLVINNTTRAGPFVSFIELTYAFTYSDDGLALPSAVILPTGDYGGATTSAFARSPSVGFESATLNVDVASDFGPNPTGPGYVITASTIGAPVEGVSFLDGYLMFGLNDHPDSFSGSLTLTIGVTSAGLQDFAQVTGVSVTSSVAAIPEPSTYALLLSGLAFVMLFGRRARS
jgi:hypothetical protein